MGGARIVTGIFLQVRLNSTRLPRKALLPLKSGNVIAFAMRALRKVSADHYVLLTDAESAPELSHYAETEGFGLFIGPQDDVLLRFCMAARRYGVTRVVRATGDNPLVSPLLARRILDIHTEAGADLSHYIGIPIGTGVEVVEAAALFRSEKDTRDPFEREHMTTHIYRNRNRYRVLEKQAPPEYVMPSARVTLDTEEDYRWIVRLVDELYRSRPMEPDEVIRWLREHDKKAGNKKAAFSGKRVLLVPSMISGGGIGHFKRCAALLHNGDINAFLYIPEKNTDAAAVTGMGRERLVFSLKETPSWDLIVIDGRATTKEQYETMSAYGITAAVDEGGSARPFIPYLVDTLLTVRSGGKRNGPNITAQTVPAAERRKKSFVFPFQTILISFGGDDPGSLSKKIADTLIGDGFYKPEAVTIVRGPRFSSQKWPAGVRIIDNPESMEHLYPEHDCLITHFGLTCFEALAAGVPVILFNPSNYHKRLTGHYRLPHIGVHKPDIGKLRRLLASGNTFQRVLDDYRINSENDFPSLLSIINDMYPTGNASCPLCGRVGNKVIARFPEKSYFLCSGCRIIHAVFFRKEEQRYDRDYFFSGYRKQYGKTYLEDFRAIKESGARRIRIIKKLLRAVTNPFLLDIGCAYGPFLDAAAGEGFRCRGIDICEDAVVHVRETLGIDCDVCDFTEKDDRLFPNGETYDTVSMWFVIEHFQNTSEILIKVNRLLKPGGFFAFSTPSASGISARKDLRSFLCRNPSDHFTLWKPRMVKSVLKRFGFTVRKIVITGHHPERFPGMKDIDKNPKKMLNRCLILGSRAAGLGDTFEVYAEKVRGVL